MHDGTCRTFTFCKTTCKICLIRDGVNFNHRSLHHMFFFKCKFSNIFFKKLKKLYFDKIDYYYLQNVFLNPQGQGLRTNTDIFNMWLPATVSKLAEARLKVSADRVAISRGQGSIGRVGDF